MPTNGTPSAASTDRLADSDVVAESFRVVPGASGIADDRTPGGPGNGTHDSLGSAAIVSASVGQADADAPSAPTRPADLALGPSDGSGHSANSDGGAPTGAEPRPIERGSRAAVARDPGTAVVTRAPASGEDAVAREAGLAGTAASPAPGHGVDLAADARARSGATPAQLRRFIKSRPYVPLHELRRRFGLNGHDDDVVIVEVEGRDVWVGLPADEGRMLGELIRQGEVGCELSLDPSSPVVVGVYPMRPVART